MAWTDHLWFSARSAKDAGLTHHGYLWGVPVYCNMDEENSFLAAAKFPPLRFWIYFCESSVNFMLGFCSAETEFVTPFTLGDPIEAEM